MSKNNNRAALVEYVFEHAGVRVFNVDTRIPCGPQVGNEIIIFCF